MKKFLAIILTVAMLLSIFTVAFAAEEEIQTSEIAATETDSEENIATLYLCSAIYVWPISGHTWIYVHNNSDEPIQVGLMEVAPDEGVSVGAFSFSSIEGWGLYYNVEAYKENNKNRAHKVRSISEEMNASELAALNDALEDYPNIWSFTLNCATFSFSMWNAVTGDMMVSLLIPAITDIMLIAKGAEKGAVKMYQPPRENVFRQRGSGAKATLSPVSDYTAN